jgi:predicted outer membrane repeat protein
MRGPVLRPWIVRTIVLGVSIAMIGAQGIRAGDPVLDATIRILPVRQGTLGISATWGPQQNPHVVTGELRVPKGLTLTVLPGTVVSFQEGARIVVNGRLLAEGTPADPIRFTRAPGNTRWLGLQFDQTMEDNRIRHAFLEYAVTNDGMVGLQKSRLLLEYVDFDHCDRRRIRTLNSSLIVRHCRFADMFAPGAPPTSDNLSENLWGSGIPDDGWLIVEDNVFGRNKGHNDAIDFDGPAAPKPIPHIRNNTFLGGGDDALDLECDALIEGNTFTNFVKDQYNKASGEANVLSAGSGKHYTLRHNLFINVQHLVQVKNDAFVTFTNNTAVNVSGAAIYFDLNLPGRRPGRGGDIENCIFWNTPEVFAGITERTEFAVDYCLLPVKWHGLGTGNFYADPLFARVGYWDSNGTPSYRQDDFWVEGDYHLKSTAGRWDPALGRWVVDNVTSPCIDAGDESSLDWMNEPWPHGGRLNLGAYGGTAQASMSPAGLGAPADLNGDIQVDLRDYGMLAGGWRSREALRREDLSRDSAVDFSDLATFTSWWLWDTRR